MRSGSSSNAKIVRQYNCEITHMADAVPELLQYTEHGESPKAVYRRKPGLLEIRPRNLFWGSLACANEPSRIAIQAPIAPLGPFLLQRGSGFGTM